MKNYRVNSLAKQRGMTLIELTVVLLILIGLAGLLLPYVGGFNERTQNSSAADSLAEVSRAVNRFEAQFNAFPDGFDSLDNGTALITWLPNNDLGGAVYLRRCEIVEAQRNNFIASEIDSLFPMRTGTPEADDYNATFAGVVTGGSGINGAAPIDAGTHAACLNGAGVTAILRNKLGVEADDDDLDADETNNENDYYVLGVGQNTQMSSKTISEAPVYFNPQNPTSNYSRFLAVFKVSRDGPTALAPTEPTRRVQFVAALSPDFKTQSDFQQAHFASIEDDD